MAASHSFAASFAAAQPAVRERPSIRPAKTASAIRARAGLSSRASLFFSSPFSLRAPRALRIAQEVSAERGASGVDMNGRVTASAGAGETVIAAPPTTPLPPFSKDGFERQLLQLQADICEESASRDGSGRQFVKDRWQRNEGDENAGYGLTCVLEGGRVLEKAAANVSIVRGELTEARAKAMSVRQCRQLSPGTPYFAAALSLVFHAAHPLIPTFRADVRYFEVDGHKGWFGGGADLTPAYLYESDISEFHRFYQTTCQAYHPDLYPTLKPLCDKYFYLPARKEHRGVGGIFFDDLESIPPPHMALPGASAAAAAGSSPSRSPPSAAAATAAIESSGFARAYRFTSDVANGFMPSFWPIVDRRRGESFRADEREWQLLRRGRYLEFNLLYDRGVRFGMDGNGRVESIMVSAPPLIAWHYNVQPEEGSPEAALEAVLRQPREWV